MSRYRIDVYECCLLYTSSCANLILLKGTGKSANIITEYSYELYTLDKNIWYQMNEIK